MHCPNCKSSLRQSQARTLSFCPTCRFPLELIGGRYQLLKMLDEGGFGIVYPTNDKRAIKFLKPSMFSQHGVYERFQREIEITSQISSMSPHVVTIYGDYGHHEVLGHYYVMEFLNGWSLRERMDDEGQMKRRFVATVFRQLCEVLALIHREGVAHRDLKPENIFLLESAGGQLLVKLLDFGIAKRVNEDPAKALTRGALGSPDYMAPEQCMGRKIGTQVDQYALATLLYQMLTGRHPIFQESMKHESDILARLTELVRKEPLNMQQFRSEISSELQACILKALNKEPEDRYENIQAFAKAALPLLQPDSRSTHQQTLEVLNIHASVEIAPSTWWVGVYDQETQSFSNPCLRLFEGKSQSGRNALFSLLVNPGTRRDFPEVRTKVEEQVGEIRKLSSIFVNHQGSDVAAAAGLILGNLAPRAKAICSQQTWEMILGFDLPKDAFIATDSYPRGFKLPTGQTLMPIKTPYCRAAGAVMLYDPQTRVLFSGDLFSGVHPCTAQNLWADESDWPSLRSWHQKNISSNEALRYSLEAMYREFPEVEIVVPQHGRLLKGQWISYYMEKLADLPVGMDLLRAEALQMNRSWTHVLNRVIRIGQESLGEAALKRLKEDKRLRDSMEWKKKKPVVTRNGRWLVEQAVELLSQEIPEQARQVMQYEVFGACQELELPLPSITNK